MLKNVSICSHFKNATGFLAAFLLFTFVLCGYADEEPQNNDRVEAFSTETIAETTITVEDVPPVGETVAADKTNRQEIKQQVIEKTKEVIGGVVAGDITATEHARTFDSFLSETFYRIQDSWVLCKHELILARQAAHDEAKQAQQKLIDKLPELPVPGNSGAIAPR